MKAAFLIGRLVFGGFFLYNGIHHLKERKQLGQYAESKVCPWLKQPLHQPAWY